MAKKDTYWFKHDSTAGRGLRMRKMAFIYGHWGKGIYWDVIEILRDQENYSFAIDELSLKMLADLIGCKDDQKFINWVNDCISIGLLKTCNGLFFSEILIENMKTWETKKENGSKGGKNKKRIDSEIIANDEAKIKHKRREDNIIEDKSIKSTQLKQWFIDLPNSSDLEDIARINNLNIDTLKNRVKEFEKHCEISYPTYGKFIFHFKNWILKNPVQPTKKSIELK